VTGSASLTPVVRERARILAPAMLVLVGFYVAAADALGLTTSPELYAGDAVCLVALAALAFALFKRRVPDRYIHLASAAVAWCAAAATLLPMYLGGDTGLLVILIVQIGGIGVLLHTGYVIGTLVVLDAAALPMLVSSSDPHKGVLVAALVTTTQFALLVHALMRRALVRAETHRRAEAATAQELAERLAELERAQAERAELADQLLHAQRMEAVGTLSAGIAHDMNNILASIVGFAELLLDEDLRAETREDVTQIVTQAQRGASLTRGLLAFSRRGAYRKQIVPIADVIRDVVPLLQRTLPKTIAIRQQLAVDDACVDADPLHIQQALINLGLNAADAMAGSGTLEITAEIVGARLKLRVTDTGKGMDAPTRLRVFEPFFTTKAPGHGTGLGLSIVWGIVHAHGGTIEVASEVGRGSSFTIHLPVTTRRQAPRASRMGSQPLAAGHTVLVVDDEPAVRKSTTRILERMGLTVITAGDGAEALQVFSDRVDVVILDMRMPVMGGAECFRALREKSSVPVLIATGYAVDSEVQELVAAGARLIEKPYAPAELRREIAQLLARPAAAAS
jgi:signal transduction histidine kinase